MPLLDRVKERIETDLSDVELQSMIDAVTQEIEQKVGANGPIVVELDGKDFQLLSLWRPIDTGEALTVTEIDGTTETVLAADDYRVRHGGRTLDRLNTGSNAADVWANLVRVAYTPVSDAARREEIVIQVVQLEIEARGVSSERAGDWQASLPELSQRRLKLIDSLAPRRGLGMA